MNEKIALHAMKTLLNGDLGGAALFELIEKEEISADQGGWAGAVVKRAAEMAIARAINLGYADEEHHGDGPGDKEEGSCKWCLRSLDDCECSDLDIQPGMGASG